MESSRIESLQDKIWDAVVVGAGPAGALAALMLALRNLNVLLVDKQTFPRPKVCGCCLNASALESLAQCGLADLPTTLNARDLTTLRIYVGDESGELHLPGNKVLSREALDFALISKAVDAGVTFLPQASARSTNVETDSRAVKLHVDQTELTVRGKTVLVATGLNSPLLEEQQGLRSVIAPSSRMGLGATLDAAPEFYEQGTVVMACGSGGYAGLVRLEDGRLNIAAALDAAYLKSFFSPGMAIANLLRHSGLPPIPSVTAAAWHGTPLLTRQRESVAAERMLALGDAAGYVEPFTGEGMAWAMLSGMLAARLVPGKDQHWSRAVEAAWTETHRRFIQERQFGCKLIARILRTPRFSKAALGLLSAVPSLAGALMRSMERPAVA